MITWLKKIFTKKPETKSHEIEIHKIHEWLNQQKNKKHEQITETFQKLRNTLQEKTREINDNIKTLQKATLMNEEIPERAKQIAQGNREEFVRRATSFANSIKVPEKIEDLPETFITNTNIIREFAEGTIRPIAVLNEFYANESKAIAADVAQVESALTEARAEYTATGLTLHDSLEKENEEISRLVSHCNEVKKTIQSAREHHARLQETVTMLRGQITELENTPNYAEFLQIKNNIQSIQNEKRRIRQEILDWFGAINSALLIYESDKNYANISKKYLQDPSTALLEDSSLRILTLLRDAKQRITEGRLDIKEKKREKVQAQLETINKLQEFQIRYRKTGTDESDMLAQLRNLPVTNQLVTLRKQLHDAEKYLPETEQTFYELEKKIPDINKMISNYQSKISAYAGTPITIKMQPNDAITQQYPADASPQ